MTHISPWFINAVLKTYYASSTLCERHYHDANHIKGMFEQAKTLGWKLSPAEELAILFHDAIYVAGGKHNEEMSVGVMRNAIGSTASDPQRFDCFLFDIKKHKDPLSKILDMAERIILDTVDHHPRIVESCRVLDLDLYGIGTTKFDDNSKNIYAEFRNLLLSQTMGDEKAAKELYKKGRSDWATAFLKRDKIYYTEACMPLEKKARKNLKKLIV